MSADLKEIYDIDTAIKPVMNSWSTPPAGLFLLIKNTTESPDTGSEYYLLIDDHGNRLLIE
jgi:hypothetical protein